MLFKPSKLIVKLVNQIHPWVPYKLAYWVKSFIAILLASFKSWVDHRASSKGAALAFYTLFSLTPILILVISIGGYFFGEQAAKGQIISQIQGLVGPNGANAIQALLASARNKSDGLWATLIASGLLLIGATSVFSELKGSLDELWGVKKSKLSVVSVLLRTRLLSFGLVLILAFLLLISLVVSAALAFLDQYLGNAFSGATLFFKSLSLIVSFGVIASLFATIYKLLPDEILSWYDVWMGAFFTAILFMLGKYFIGLYLGNSAIASSFGAAGSIIALLLWVYYSAQIFFLGSEFTRQFAIRFGSLQQKKQVQLALDKVLANPLNEVASEAKNHHN